MADAAVLERTPDQIAADTAATEKVTADKAVATRAAADAAAAANAGTPAERLAADKATTGAELARKAADQAKPPDTYTLTLPEQTDFDATDLALFGAEARALGLSQIQAQALVTTRAQTVTALKQQYVEEAQRDPEIGGAKFDETVRLATTGRDWLFPPNSEEARLVIALLDKTGLGNHKALLRAFARIGRAKQEDTHVRGGGASTKEHIESKDVFYANSTSAKT